MAETNTQTAIVVKNLRKAFGTNQVLKGVDFSVRRGEILALLGPNGAGKTTTIKILSTLLLPDSGQAVVCGHDAVKDAAQVRSSIGLTGQYAAVDQYLTGEENLLMMGRLYRLSAVDTKARARELLQLFDLKKAADRPVKGYSGGMRRKLDLAMSLIASPPVIFLDEPTTGLDPRSRIAMWELIKKLAKAGITILLTTQYMDEADNLADNIIVIDGGKVIAQGTPNQLKGKMGSDRLEFTLKTKTGYDKALTILTGTTRQTDEERRTISLANTGGIPQVRTALQKLEDARVDVENFSLHRPTLDDVFLTLTGHTASADNEPAKKGKR